MKQTKEKKIAIRASNTLHKKNCRSLSKRLEAKYSRLGILSDGYLKVAIMELVKNYKSEEALLACEITVSFIQKLYNTDEEFHKLLDQTLLSENTFGENINGLEAINCLHRFHSRIFNFFTPGWIDMHRLLSNPELFTDDDLDYLQTVFVEDDFAEGFDENK